MSAVQFSSAGVFDIATGLPHQEPAAAGFTAKIDLSEVVAAAPVRTLAPGTFLFEQGDIKSHVYQVEAGVLTLFRTSPEGHAELLDIAHPGSLVGLGHMVRHGCHAMAEVESRVRCLALDAVRQFAEVSADLGAEVDRAQVAEFEQSRQVAIAFTAGRPALKTASLLLVLSSFNRSEGRDPGLITDELKCGSVAGYLGLSIDDLSRAVRELAEIGLVAAGPGHSLKLLDVPALEQLVEGA
jgi:CRP/FNR family transcriptional regulator